MADGKLNQGAWSDLAATMADYAFPLRFFDIEVGPYGIIEDVGNAIAVDDTLKGISHAVPIIEDIAYDLDAWTVKFKARWPW